MKRTFLLIQLVIVTLLSVSQSIHPDTIQYLLRIVPGKKGIDMAVFPGYCDRQESFLAKNCLSDYQVKGRMYRYCNLIRMTKDSVFVARPGDEQHATGISPADLVSLNAILCCRSNGMMGFGPVQIHSGDFEFSIVPGDDCLSINTMNVCWDEACEEVYVAYEYWEAGQERTFIFRKDGAYYRYGMGEEETKKLEVEY